MQATRDTIVRDERTRLNSIRYCYVDTKEENLSQDNRIPTEKESSQDDNTNEQNVAISCQNCWLNSLIKQDETIKSSIIHVKQKASICLRIETIKILYLQISHQKALRKA